MLDRLRSLSGLELLRINPALARDQVAALAQQLPLLYAILLVNALALSVTHLGVAPATMTLVAPGVLCAACAWRALAWTRITIADMTDAAAVGRLRTTTWLTVLFAIAFAWWSAGLYPYGSVYAQFHVVFYMSLTSISCIFCLTHLLPAALLLSTVVLITLLTMLLHTKQIVMIAIATNIVLVTTAVVIVTLRNYRTFATLILSQKELLVRQDAMRALSNENQRLANVDSLTGLPNRRCFFMAFEAARENALASGKRLSMILFDLDGFKRVNDLHGHAAGDRVLVEVAERVSALTGPSILAARLGGDEFAILHDGDAGADAIAVFARRLESVLRAGYLVPDIGAHLAGSGGLVTFDGSELSVGEMFERADNALYHAKLVRRGSIIAFTEEHDLAFRRQHRIEQELRTADLEHELDLVFQPLVDTITGLTVGVEALMRWRSPTLGPIAPDIFMPIAEQARISGRITTIALDKALAAAAAWPDGVQLVFNLSPLDLIVPATAEAIRRIITDDARWNGAARSGRILVRISESAAIRDVEQAGPSLALLRASGVGIMLGDVGAGLTSFRHLRRLRPDAITLDRGLVAEIETDDASRSIVHAVVALCRDMSVDCMAAGIETRPQAEMLRALGCRVMQGALLGHPLTADGVHACLAGERREPAVPQMLAQLVAG